MTDTPEQTRKCSNCMWWDDEPPRPGLGMCRGAPPQFVYLAGRPDPEPHWPTTAYNDWCGSFRMKEPGQ